MEYLSLSKESFSIWCDAVNIQACKYEFSSRTYYLSSEFYALADKEEIKKIKELHGDQWHLYYSKYDDVKGFIRDDEPKQQVTHKEYKAKSNDVADFIKSLKD